jgi:hypothetical protein
MEPTAHPATSGSGSHSSRRGWVGSRSRPGLLPIELPLGTAVELEIKLPTAPVATSAIVRNRNAFLYGLEFVQSLRDARYRAGPDDCKECAGYPLHPAGIGWGAKGRLHARRVSRL